MSLSSSDTFCFGSERVLEFNHNNLITGINIIDDLLFWTDNFTEPKKINIPRSVAGTDILGDTHTAVVNNTTGLNISNYYPIRKEHVTVIRKSPKNALTLEMQGGRDPALNYAGITYTSVATNNLVNPNVNESSIISSGNPSVTTDFSSLIVGDFVKFEIETDINGDEDFTLEWKPGNIILLKEFLEDGSGCNGAGCTPPPFPLSNYTIRGRITDWQYNRFVNDTNYPGYNAGLVGSDWNTGSPPPSAAGTAHVEIEVLNLNGTPPEPDATNGAEVLHYVVDLEEVKDSIFTDVFSRYSYRYKYSDGEYSTFAPWSEVAFFTF